MLVPDWLFQARYRTVSAVPQAPAPVQTSPPVLNSWGSLCWPTKFNNPTSINFQIARERERGTSSETSQILLNAFRGPSAQRGISWLGGHESAFETLPESHQVMIKWLTQLFNLGSLQFPHFLSSTTVPSPQKDSYAPDQNPSLEI